jgi:hypothetical protein
MGDEQLQAEFTRTEGRDVRSYWRDHGPAWNDAYVEWLEALVRKSRNRPDLNQCFEQHPGPLTNE